MQAEQIRQRDLELIEATKERKKLYDKMTLGEIAEELVQVKLMRKFFEEVDDAWKQNDYALKRLAREKMDEAGLDEFAVDDAAKIKKKTLSNPKILNNVKFFLWLESRGEESLGKLHIAPHLVTDEMKQQMIDDPESVKLYVHHSTLKSFIENQCDLLDPSTWPAGVELKPDATVYVSMRRNN